MKRCALLSAALAGCFLPSYEKVEGGGGGGAGGAGGEDVCALANPPAAPSTPPPGGEVEFFVAMRVIDVGDAHLPSRPGYDLDGVCACCSGCTGSLCVAPAAATLEACDAVSGQPNGGRDNNFAKYAAGLGGSALADLRSSGMSQLADRGLWGVVLRVSQYNGDPDDGEVTVALHNAVGSPAEPLWDGNDAWQLRSDSFGALGTLDDALFVQDGAYVSDGVLVVTFPATVSLALPLNFVLPLEDVTLQARIAKDAQDDFELVEGVLGGRVRITDALAALGGTRFQGFPVVCTDTLDYASLYKDPLCAHRDESTVSLPAPCDAVSFGMSFSAEQIGDAPSIVPVDTTRLCFPEVDPAGHMCD